MESHSKRDLHGEACCGWGHPRSGRHCRGSGDPRFVEMSASGEKVVEMIGVSVGDMANPRGVVSEHVQALLTLIGLDKLAGSYPGSMGRNWQQRVGLARALVLRPEALLLDNALAGLDPRDSWWWLELLAELSEGHPIMGEKPMTL